MKDDVNLYQMEGIGNEKTLQWELKETSGMETGDEGFQNNGK